ncbi:hypothetical protein BN2476_930040 [Paraburkholderia piptadeniae]|uniref:Uncharacterized protein n=1 Tax=Paraburkholderia piptadeniae TaxID=1701573 RepID=A0A1N7STT0_9BURK|nr:hypothetical protein BN2476_930040 [Paraburkholderia piptadeniae]
MSRIRPLSARAARMPGRRATRAHASRVSHGDWRGRPLSRTEWTLLVLWACLLTSVLWATALVALIRAIQRTLD